MKITHKNQPEHSYTCPPAPPRTHQDPHVLRPTPGCCQATASTVSMLAKHEIRRADGRVCVREDEGDLLKGRNEGVKNRGQDQLWKQGKDKLARVKLDPGRTIQDTCEGRRNLRNLLSITAGEPTSFTRGPNDPPARKETTTCKWRRVRHLDVRDNETRAESQRLKEESDG